MRFATTRPALRRALLTAAPIALSLALAGCFDGDDDDSPTPTPTAAPTPTPTGTPTPAPSPAGRNVTACLNQMIPGTGETVASLVVPDTMRLNTSQPAGFPNGRRLQDPVIDVELAVLFLDLRVHSPATFANLPLNPATNDRPFLNTFPFAAPPQGNPPLATGTGMNFNFRTDPPSAYTRVDRTGQPAIATAVIGAPLKNPYNDADPADDATGVFVPEIVNQLTLLHNGLADDLIALGLTPCSTP